jgi:Mor family transcriptional regulator
MLLSDFFCCQDSGRLRSGICFDYDTGKYSGVELARKYSLQERQIWNILGRSGWAAIAVF